MVKKKVSIIFTVLNEEKSVSNLLESIAKQTRKPDEIVVVDGGSRDKTVEVLKRYSKKLLMRIFVAKGANISQGRNIAIQHAIGPIIVTTDGGTVHDKNWLKSIVKNIEAGYDVSAGLFYPLPKTEFEEIVGRLFYPNMDKVPDDWRPSSRSAAFTKKVWKESGGYPEELYTAEDAVFNYRLKEVGARYKTARNTKSYWRPRSNFKRFFKQYFTYAKGNGESLLALYRYPECRMFYLFWSLVIAGIVAYFWSQIMPLFLLIAFLMALFAKSFRALWDFRKALIGVGLLLSAFVANALGNHYGLLRRLLGKVKVKKVEYIKIVK